MKPTAWSTVISAVVVLVLIAASVFLARRPYYNWDMFPYMALAMDRSDLAFAEIHQEVYRSAQETMLPSDFQAISSRQQILMEDPAAFEAVLPYFQIKPGYILMVSALYNFGVHPLTATWLPSIIGYLAVGLMLFFYSRRFAPTLVAAILMIVMAAPVMTDLARYSSPDMLCAALSLAGFIFLLSSKTTAGLSFLTAAVTVRPDAAILSLLMVAALWWSKRMVTAQALSWMGAQFAILYFEFYDAPFLISEYVFSTSSYAERVDFYSTGLGTLLRSLTLPMVAVSLAIVYVRRKAIRPDFPSLLVWAAIISIAARIILHPYVEDRFHLPAYLVVLVVAWETVASRFITPNGLKPDPNSSMQTPP